MNILQQIFADHYEEILYTLHPRATEIENITKMINCGDPSYGGAMYACPKCGHLKFVPFRCHSRFCPTCGTHYAQKRAMPWRISWSPFGIDIAFLQFRKIFAIFSKTTVLSWIACLPLFSLSFFACFLNKINRKTSLPVLSVCFILLAAPWNRIRIFIVWFQKVATLTTANGVIFITLITNSCANHFAQLC